MACGRGYKLTGEAHELDDAVLDSSGGSRSLQVPELRLAIEVATAVGFWQGIRSGPRGLPVEPLYPGARGPQLPPHAIPPLRLRSVQALAAKTRAQRPKPPRSCLYLYFSTLSGSTP